MSARDDTEHERAALAVVLAAGEGSRMRSTLPKVLHPVAGLPMLVHALRAAAGAGAGRVVVVVGPGSEDVAAVARQEKPGTAVRVQAERLGTAHAVLAARDLLSSATLGDADLLVLFADTPLVTPATARRLLDALGDGAAVAVAGFRPADPTGYGRLIERDGSLLAVREHRDASADERRVGLCNAGLMALRGAHALALLDAVRDDNAQGEFYLTDVVAAARAAGLRAAVVEIDAEEAMGVNDRVQLATAEAAMQRRLREAAMRAGVTLVAPETVFLSHDTMLGRDVRVEPHVVFGPGVTVEAGAVIHAFSHLEGARVGPGASVGPYARLRPGADLGEGARAGNFVEVKAAKVGAGAKINHLAYVGDAEVGAGANIGAGVITCNYDGHAKHRTRIGAGAFVGSNASLVAPVSVGAGAYVASGSVVTRDVPEDALALGRARQEVKPGWAARLRAHRAKD